MNFEEELKKLEKISAAMKNPELSLDESMKMYEQAVQLTKELKKYIADAELKIEGLEENNNVGE